jgi:hypothetical protein
MQRLTHHAVAIILPASPATCWLTIVKELALVTEAAPSFVEITTLLWDQHRVTPTRKATKNSLSWALP